MFIPAGASELRVVEMTRLQPKFASLGSSRFDYCVFFVFSGISLKKFCAVLSPFSGAVSIPAPRYSQRLPRLPWGDALSPQILFTSD
jgi:hypothetical protein